MKAVAVGLQFPPPWQPPEAAVIGSIECPDTAAARRLATVVEGLTVVGLGSTKVVAPPPESNDSFVTFQLRGSSEAVAGVLGKGGMLGLFLGKK